MSYIPTTWETGDTITAEKLNNMENGIDNVTNGYIAGALYVEFEYNQDETDDTWLFETKMTVDELWGTAQTASLVSGSYINVNVGEIDGEDNDTKIYMDMYLLNLPFDDAENPQILVKYYRSNGCSLNANEHFKFGDPVAIWYADLTLDSN